MASGSSGRSKPKAVVAAVIIGSCAIATLLFDEPSSYFLPQSTTKRWPPTEFSDRRLSQDLDLENEEGPQDEVAVPAVYPWARKYVRPTSRAPDPSRETVLFWHIPKSGGTTMKKYYTCLPKHTVVRSKAAEIMRSKESGLVQSGRVDVIFSSDPNYAIGHLFDRRHMARALAVFRHPVDRLVSKFYYLQVATWEKTYRPDWKDIDVLEWAKNHNSDNDHMVKRLAGKTQLTTATQADLDNAKSTIGQRFIVGLTEDMEEAVRRFDVVMGISDETDKFHEKCLNRFFGEGKMKSNSNEHPKVERGSPAWDMLAEKNSFDIQLYEYVLGLYEEQKDTIASYESSAAVKSIV